MFCRIIIIFTIKEDRIISITKIKIHNFKSFKDLEINLNSLNLFVGCNASGKSNFISIFEFFRGLTPGRNRGLKNAISLQGGIDFFRNVNLLKSNEFSLEVTSNHSIPTTIPIYQEKGKERFISATTSEIVYKFKLLFSKNKRDVSVIEDILKMKCNFFKINSKGKKHEDKEILGKGEFLFKHNNRKITFVPTTPKEIKINEELFFPTKFIEQFINNKTLLIETPIFVVPFDLSRIFSDIAIYNFDPKKTKKAIPLKGKEELEEDGENFAKALKNIIDNRDEKRKFLNLIKDILPFVKDLKVVNFIDKSLFVTLEEILTKKMFPAFSISDGTINVALLIIALYFEKKQLIIIEEPERNLHPYLISRIVSMMKEVSKDKQIIITTHNPEMLKHVDLKDILLISRDKNRFSRISRPVEKRTVREFLKNDLGIDEIFASNFLGSYDEV